MEDLDRSMQKPQEKDTIPVPTTMRVSPVNKNQINDLVKELNCDNQDQVLSYLFRLYDTNQIKEGLPGRETEIEAFESHLNGLFEIYKGSLRICQDTEIRIKEKFAGTLTSNDKTIQSLQNELKAAADKEKEMKEDITKLTEETNYQKEKIKQIEKERDTAEGHCNEYKNQNQSMIDTVNEFQEDHKRVASLNEELLTMKNQLAKAEASVQKKQEEVEALTGKNKNCFTDIENLQRQVKTLTEDRNSLSAQITELQQKHQQEMFIKDQEKAMALLEAREGYYEQIEKERKNAREEYAGLLSKIQIVQPTMQVNPKNTP